MKKLKKLVLNTTTEVLSSNQMRQMVGGSTSYGYGYGYFYWISCHGIDGPFTSTSDCSDTTKARLCGKASAASCVIAEYEL